MKEFLLTQGLIPDVLIRRKIRSLLRQRLKEEHEKDTRAILDKLRGAPLAIETKAANEQHYEVPTRFFQWCLGKHLKYSCCLFEGTDFLDEAEVKMLNLYCERAEIRNGQEILELGCGWGSFSLFLAEKYPGSSITAVSNSRTQKAYIDEEVAKRGLSNLRVITCDINEFDPHSQFDRIVSIEMFEHLRNYRELFRRISEWMRPDAKMFVHIFTHHKYTYAFEVRDESDWMSKYFFTGGIMPSEKLFYEFREHLQIMKEWRVNGVHYSRTAECWLKNMDKHKREILECFKEVYGTKNRLWFEYWRIFYMACSELWKFQDGKEWGVNHYLFEKVRS